MVLKIDFDTVKLQKLTYDIIFMTSQKVSILMPLSQHNPSFALAVNLLLSW